MYALFSAAVILIGNERCLLACISDITEQQRVREERERLIAQCEQALSKIRILSRLLPICAACKKIRDDKGYWKQIERYLRTHTKPNSPTASAPTVRGKCTATFWMAIPVHQPHAATDSLPHHCCLAMPRASHWSLPCHVADAGCGVFKQPLAALRHLLWCAGPRHMVACRG